MPELTKAQQTAVDEQSKTLLVSAAAGSGKTFTLVERVLRSVVRKDNPIPIGHGKRPEAENFKRYIRGYRKKRRKRAPCATDVPFAECKVFYNRQFLSLSCQSKLCNPRTFACFQNGRPGRKCAY